MKVTTEKKEDIRARVFKIESLNTHNGPGYRTVIYLKGCPLNCIWCHNPEGISLKKEIWVNHTRCIKCASCIKVCPNEALSLIDNRIEVDRDICAGCYACAEICPSAAIEKIGEDLSVLEVFERLMRDKPFFDASGGGVTLTGGEPGTAPEFVSRLFQKCQKSGIHTAFDTSGFISKKALEMIIPHTDLVFFDLKVMDNTKAVKLTGQGIARIIGSLDWIKSYILTNGKPELHFRTPLIPKATDNEENLNGIAQLIRKNYSEIYQEWELNLFNDICEDKYQKLNKAWNYKDIKMNAFDYQKIEKFKEKNQEFNITISGFVSK
jgi:pyruvate formate lyase activating enzyme